MGGLTAVERTVRLCATFQTKKADIGFVRPFLEAITHPSLLRSLSIDSFVGTIYRVIGGSNGDLGLDLFSTLTLQLSEIFESPKTYLVLVVSSLYELLRRERKCLLHDALPELLDALLSKATEFAVLIGDADAPSPNLDATTVRIGTMKRMMDGARGRIAGDSVAATTNGRDAGPVHSTFPLEVVVPGGRHDNDFADISKIQIFPTLGEITSDAAEYLPMTDLTQRHFLDDPVQRHLDSAFRLLRHDIFGPLKDVVGAVLAQSNIADASTSSRFIDGNIRAHRYPRAFIQHVLVNGGLEAILSFAQPPQLRRFQPPERRRWWEESSRLEPGNLVCFVSSRGDGGEKSFLLFIVTKKNTKDAQQDEKMQSTLVSDYNPAVTARLASQSLENVTSLHRMYVARQEGLLIELPSLIPDTFVPILENLQQMMRDGDLAFRRWILPTSESDPDHHQALTDVSPPAYARQPRFRFRLDSILRSGHASISIDPVASGHSVSPEILEDATGLDRGQSEALIAALTREYALIQGPPGTGKSYVGVQLVRVLLDHKDEADLGPILVM